MSQLKKTNLNSVKELQKTTDEQLGSVLQNLGYEESFKIIDLKLGLGTITVVIAGLLFLADKKFKFKDIYNITLISCVVYGIVNAALFLINLKYKNVKYIGYNKKGGIITIASEIKKYEPNYYVTITIDDKAPNKTVIPFNKFFDIIGFFNRDEFLKLLSSDINKKSE
ncbi:SPC2 [Candida pseudojiufengensis]|uniref:SPC2 n=1 Tax=Candida pseudojiufengensis TaxID=497109 RepID=UPI002224AD07|nr:SPC2 [Candida pseudojiufengensis]KAI5965637.1 SPC2 [Candida pseudojiufengensis]